jgi:molybdate transport system regulatory protein
LALLDDRLTASAGERVVPDRDQPRLHLKLILRPGSALGPGKIALLESIAATGSIRAAGAGFKMSYKRAWSLVAELNGMFAGPLVIAEAGGKGGGGAALTPLGEEVARRFRAIEQNATAVAEADLHFLAAELTDPAPSP